MSLISLVITLAVVGFLLWLLERYVPMDATIRDIIRVVVVVVIIIWLLQMTGLMPDFGAIRVGK